MHAALTQLAHLFSQPMLVHGDAGLLHSAALAGLVRRLLDTGERASLFGDSQNNLKPWEKREQPTILGTVAIVPVTGVLAAGLDPITAWWLDCQRYEALQSAAATLGGRSDIRTVIFNFDTPGGYTNGVAETTALIKQHLEGKATIAWSATKNCSCGYWLSTACDRIIAAPSATLANVGTLLVHHDYSEMYKQAGIAVTLFKTGAFKGAGTPGTSLTAEQKTFMQERIDEIGAQFLGAVKAARPGVADADLEGQWYSGTKAVEKKFADATALNLDELLAALGEAQRV